LWEAEALERWVPGQLQEAGGRVVLATRALPLLLEELEVLDRLRQRQELLVQAAVLEHLADAVLVIASLDIWF
jgi:hypothetical protein